MVNLVTYDFNPSDINTITPKEYFTGVYVEEVFKLENVRTCNQQMCAILGTKKEKADFN